ncbi:M16 family metallopeptidase [Rhodococcoides kroppenstedtii]|uniref:M16 family metallopeptidase n=1 Tax=Rhodococcoides kroppenstedtii TaxID=293050 RepID=UPI0027E106B2|nr:insulinase family protein [Rhodococcus kroppenstedtii]
MRPFRAAPFTTTSSGSPGTRGGTTHQDFTEYTQRVPVGCLDDAVFAEVDRLFAAEIGDEAMAEQLPGVIAEVRHHSGHAFGGFPWPAMGPVLFADHAHAHDGWGDPADLARMDASTCRRFHERCYRPADAVLTVVGDVDLETVVGAIDRACRGHRPAPARTPRDTPRPRWRDGASVRVRVPGEGPSAFAVGYALPDPIDHLDEYLAATVLTGTRPADGTPWSAASGVFGPLEVARGDVLTVTTSPWWGTGTAARVGRSIAGLHGRTVDVPAATPASTLEWSVVDVDGVDGVAAGPTADPAAYAALTAIGGFHGARLHAATTVDAYAGRDTLLGAPRTFVVASGAPASSLDAMQSDIARWHRDVSERPLDDDEIHRARCFAAGQLSSMIESPAHLADTTSRSLATGTPPETVLALPSAVAAVDPSRVRAAVPDLVAGRCAFTVRSRSRHDYTGTRDHPDHHDTGGTP